MSALYLTMNMLIEPGDEVIAIGPVWPNIYSTVEIHGGVVRHASVELVDGEWRLDLDRLFALASERTNAIFVNSPGNLTGWIMEADAQRALLDFARSRGIWVVADEGYHQWVFDREEATALL